MLKRKNDLSLSLKIKYINKTVPIGVVADLVGLPSESTQQVHCPFHEDSNKSARIFVHDIGDTANGLFCYVCGNFTVFNMALKYFGDSYQDTLNYFENNLGVKYKGLDFEAEENQDENYNKKLAKIINKLRKKDLNKKELVKIAKYIHTSNFKKLNKICNLTTHK